MIKHLETSDCMIWMYGFLCTRLYNEKWGKVPVALYRTNHMLIDFFRNPIIQVINPINYGQSIQFVQPIDDEWRQN